MCHRDDSCIYVRSHAGTLVAQAALDAFSAGAVSLNWNVADDDIEVGYLILSSGASNVGAHVRQGLYV